VIIPGGPRFGFEHLRPALDSLCGHSRGHLCRRGGSSPTGDVDSISTAGTLTDLDAVLDGLELERVALVGHSLAAHMVALYAATRPERVRALVLLNPAPPFAPEHREEFGKEMKSRRTPDEAEEMERVESSPSLRQVMSPPSSATTNCSTSRSSTTVTSPWARSTGLLRTERGTATPRSGSSPTSASTHCQSSSAASRARPSSFMASVIRYPSHRRRQSPRRSTG